MLASGLLNSYTYRPSVSQNSLDKLNSVVITLGEVMKKYKEVPLDTLVLPYGELAYVLYERDHLVDQINDAIPALSSTRNAYRRENKYLTQVNIPRIRGTTKSAAHYLQRYLEKAINEDRPEHAVKALLNLGDVQLLSGRRESAAAFYRRAWEESEKLDENHPLVLSMESPVLLPAFLYSYEQEELPETYRPTIEIPIEISLSKFGRVTKIHTKAKQQEDPKMAKRAISKAKISTFRPIISQGEMVETNSFIYAMAVKSPRKRNHNSVVE